MGCWMVGVGVCCVLLGLLTDGILPTPGEPVPGVPVPVPVDPVPVPTGDPVPVPPPVVPPFWANDGMARNTAAATMITLTPTIRVMTSSGAVLIMAPMRVPGVLTAARHLVA